MVECRTGQGFVTRDKIRGKVAGLCDCGVCFVDGASWVTLWERECWEVL